MDVVFKDLISAALGILVGAGIVWALFRRVVEDVDHRIATNKDELQRLKSDLDGIEKDALKGDQDLHTRLSDLLVDMPKEYVRLKEFETTVGDIRSRLGGIEHKLDSRIDEVLRAIRTK